MIALTPGSRIHLIGIGGTGLSAIARVLVESGFRVSGSDRQLSPLAESLLQAGVEISLGHQAAAVRGADLVVRSSAVADANPEVQEALRLGIPVLKRADFLGALMENHIGVAVAGTHGKTTTTAMAAWVLYALGEDPSYIIGGISTNLGSNAHAGEGRFFVIEADEYDRMFHGLQPTYAVITNVEHDHPDCYPTAEDFFQAFLSFGRLVRPTGALLVCSDDTGAARLAADLHGERVPVYRYGLENPTLDYTAMQVTTNNVGGFSFNFQVKALKPGDAIPVRLRVPGKHNVLNAVAVLAIIERCGLDLTKAAEALGEFLGSGRRFDVVGEAAGVIVIDDYGHHPTEIRATLSAARARYPRHSLWAVWQPHTYSRTQTLFDAFSQAFSEADHVVVTEIYPSREQPPAGGYSSRLVTAAINRPDVTYAGTLDAAVALLSSRLGSESVVIVFSAGDADQVSRKVLTQLMQKEQAHV